MSDCLILRSLLKIKNLTNTIVLESSYRKFYRSSDTTMSKIYFSIFFSKKGNYIIRTFKDYGDGHTFYHIVLRVKDESAKFYIDNEEFDIDEDLDLNMSDMELILLFSRGILDANIRSLSIHQEDIDFNILKENAEYLD